MRESNVSDGEITPSATDRDGDGPPRKSRLRVGVSSVLLVILSAVILAITLRPVPVTEGKGEAITKVLQVAHQAGAGRAFDYDALEFTANIVMFLPFGFLVALLLPWRRIWVALLLVTAFSGAIELTQTIFLAQRWGTFEDLLANSIGGWIGVAVAVVLRALVRRRDRQLLARAAYFAERGEPLR
ncbi:VanZ family protein [Microbacterium gorillae]|uniref:VanZ family protein n=1 Tax=Microbacterium gorillae TaxID=1231063 RepID=UPI0018A881B3|nr:VanZ family protein [Microbacterium gorillae]